MASQDRIDSLQELYEKWNNLNTDHFIRKNLGKLSLTSYQNILGDSFAKLGNIIQVAPELGNTIVENLYRHLHNIYQVIIENSNLDDKEFINAQDRIINILKSNYESIKDYWPDVVAILNYKNSNENDNETLKKNSERLYEELRQEREKSFENSNTIDSLRKKLEFELKNFDERYKELLSKAELIKQQDLFENEALGSKKSSKKWLITSIVALGILLLIICYYINHLDSDLDSIKISIFKFSSVCITCNQATFYYLIIKMVIIRLLIISLSIYTLVFCIKNYNANKHNQIVNQHKSNSLAAARALLERAKTDIGNDNIMSQAAQSIFAHQNSGYLGKENEPNNPMFIDRLIDKSIPSSK